MNTLKQLIYRLLIESTNHTGIQFFRYLFVGGAAAMIDTGTLLILYSHWHINYLFAAAIAFFLGLAANYLISVFWVFQSSGNPQKEFFLFAVIGGGGLLWTLIILKALVEFIPFTIINQNIHLMIAKFIALILVLIWNFVMRKKFVFSAQPQTV